MISTRAFLVAMLCLLWFAGVAFGGNGKRGGRRTVRLEELNRKSWNAATEAHITHKPEMGRFLRNGGSTLYREERGLLGDVRGKSVLHLQCNCGEDSLSIGAMGATVTGVDISDVAIKRARQLSKQSRIRARFERGDVYAWLAKAGKRGRRFDIVFSSYGAVQWLKDLRAWSSGISGVLNSGGRLVLVDTHPELVRRDQNWQPESPGQGGHLVVGAGVSDYVGTAGTQLTPVGFAEGVTDFENPHQSATYDWSIAEIREAVNSGDLELETLEEYHHANTPSGARLVRDGDRWVAPAEFRHIPLMFGLSSRKR
jgi:SAM-dependent methyltransferase